MASKKKGQVAKGKQSGKAVKAEQKASSAFSPSNIRDFVHQVQAEFKKIVWPDKKVTFGLTGFVLVLVMVLAIYLGSVDLLLGKLVSSVLQ